MHSRELIESYVSDVVRRLPRRIRKDVGLELHTLLSEELEGLAGQTGRKPDAAMTTELLLRFGRPEDVAGRYRTKGFDLVEPGHAPLFVRLSLICVALQWALTLPAVFRRTSSVGDWWLGWGTGALWWPGLLIAYFATATWIRRRWPADPVTGVRPWQHWILWLPEAIEWRPVDEQAELRYFARGLIPLSTVLTLFFIAPATILGWLLPASVDVSWAAYDAEFGRWLLPVLIALMCARLGLFALAAAGAKWRIRTEWPRIMLRAIFMALLIWALFGWDIFASAAIDAGFKAWLLIFVIVNLIDMFVRLRRRLLAFRPPATLAEHNGSH